MKAAVWDTYVRKEDGSVMHFDIVVPDTLKDTKTIYNFGREYLEKKGYQNLQLTSNECQFCHIGSIAENIQKHIQDKGYYIIEIENCN